MGDDVMETTAYDLATAYDISRKELVFCDADRPVRKVARDFYEKGIGSMIVTEDGDYIGFVTDQNIFRAISEDVDVRSARVGDLKLDPLNKIKHDATLSEVASLFAETRATRLAVVDDEGKVVAVVKKKNLELLDRFNIAASMVRD